MKIRIHFILSIAMMLAALNLQAQFDYGCDGDRYIDPVITNYGQDEIKYGRNINPAGDSVDLFMDVYYPESDPVDARPLVVLAHGGSFIGGNRQDMEDYCIRLAERGYVAATVDYRLLSILNGIPDSIKAMDIAIKASHDMKGAIRWFKHNAIEDGNTYNVDPEMIFIGGYSAGAITACVAGLVDEEDVDLPFLTEIIENNGGYEGNTGDPAHFIYDTEVRGILSLSGAVYDTSWITASDPLIYSLHGTADDVVPYEKGFAKVFGIDIVPLYGSGSVGLRQQNQNLGGSLFSVEGGGHTDIYFDPSYENTRNQFLAETDAAFAEIICGVISETKLESESVVRVFPSPANSFINIDGISLNSEFQIYNSQGLLVQKARIEPNQRIDISAFNTGVYHYVVSIEGTLHTGKFVKM